MSNLAEIIAGRSSDARYSVLHHLNEALDTGDGKIQHTLALLNADPALVISRLKWNKNLPLKTEESPIEDINAKESHVDVEPLMVDSSFIPEIVTKMEPELEPEDMIETLDSISTVTYEDSNEVIDLEPIDQDVDQNVELSPTTMVIVSKKGKTKEKSKKFKLKDFSGISSYHQWLLTLKDANFEEKMARQEEKARKKRIEKEAQKSVTKSDTIISESLADILASQGHIEDAKKMYSQLMLKYPQKSSYFAAKINNI